MILNRKTSLLCLLSLILILCLLTACSNSLKPENEITDKKEMVKAFMPVNEAILQFIDLKKGSITTENAGPFMSEGILNVGPFISEGMAIRDVLEFEKNKGGTHYRNTKTYNAGESLIYEKVAEDGRLPEFAYNYYPNEPISDESLAAADMVSISKTSGGITYRVDWPLSQAPLPNGATSKEFYSTYTVDDKGYLVNIVHCRTYSLRKSGEAATTETSEFMFISLTDFLE